MALIMAGVTALTTVGAMASIMVGVTASTMAGVTTTMVVVTEAMALLHTAHLLGEQAIRITT